MDGVVPVRPWTFLRAVLAIAWLVTTVRISVPDYPYEWPIWYWYAYDPNGYLHEVWYMSGVFVCLITLTYFWQFLPILLERKTIKVFVVNSPPRERRLRASK